jgi:putative lipoic acid-binding regulatory protein
MIDLSQHKLELDYPCSWIYKVIGLSKEDIQIATKELFINREYKITQSKVSKKGKFKSYSIETLVHNEEDRQSLYLLLKSHKKIKMVL